MKTSARTIAALSLLTLAGWLVTFETPLTMRPRQAWKGQDEASVPRKSVAASPPSRDAEALRHELEARYGKGPFRFEPNTGQFAPEVKFASRGAKHTLFLTSNEARLILSGGPLDRPAVDGRALLNPRNGPRPAETVGVQMRFIGSKPGAFVSGVKPLPGRSNYLIGNDPRKWRTDIVSYAGVRYQGIYPGVDLVYYGNEGQLEYDFIVAPGADPGSITLEIANSAGGAERSVRDGSSFPRIDESGGLALNTGAEGLRFNRPQVYQIVNGKKRFIPAEYAFRGGGPVGFKLGAYDTTQPLVIDPVLNFSSYLGGNNFDSAVGVAMDSTGIYVAGRTASGSFPTTSGVVQPDPGVGFLNCAGGNACYDAFVSKLSPDGTTLIYSTYLGGSDYDAASGIAVDGSGNIYVTGSSLSPNFPVHNAFQGTLATASNIDAFIAKLDNSGSNLLYSTYLGGPGEDDGIALAVDSSRNVYITGYTVSTKFPATAGALGGGTCGTLPCGDAFVAKFDPSLSGPASLKYSTYLGGDGNDVGQGIAIDSSGNAYVAGSTFANNTPADNFPTMNAFQSAYGGGSDDGFLAKLNSTGTTLLYSTFLGGNGQDDARGIAVASTGNAYLVGVTGSNNFPTKGAFQNGLATGTCGSRPCVDAYVTKINTAAAGSASLIYSTYLGGSNDDVATSVAVDASGNAFVAGGTRSKETDTKPFPLDTPLQSTNSGDYDVFVSKFNSLGSALTFSTYVGGSNFDAAFGIAVDSAGTIYLAGEADSSDLPITTGTIQAVQGGGADSFVFRISPLDAPGVSVSSASIDLGNTDIGLTSATKSVILFNVGSATLNISDVSFTGTNAAEFDQTNTCDASVLAGHNCAIALTFTPTDIGPRTGSLTISTNAAGSPPNILLRGNGTLPGAMDSLSLTSLNFGNQPVGTPSGTRTVTVTSTGTMPVTFFSVTASGDYAASTACLAAPLAPTSTCTVNVTFTPTASGLRPGTLTLTDDTSASPHTIALSGTGVAPAVTFSTPSLTFGNQLVGTTSSAQSVTLTNTGTLALNISNIAMAGDFAKSADTCTGSLVVPSATCTISATFTPTAAGSRTGTMTLIDNAPGSPHSVNLSGTGTQEFTLSLKTNSPAINAGQTASYTITLTPAGGFNQTIAVTCTGAPKAAACSVSPNSRTLDGTNPFDATVSVTTTARSVTAPLLGPGRMPRNFGVWPPLTGLAVLLLLLMTVNLVYGRRKVVLGLAAMLLLVSLWSACGGGGGGPPPTQNGTPAGTYTLTVTATSGGLSHTLPLTLKVN